MSYPITIGRLSFDEKEDRILISWGKKLGEKVFVDPDTWKEAIKKLSKSFILEGEIKLSDIFNISHTREKNEEEDIEYDSTLAINLIKKDFSSASPSPVFVFTEEENYEFLSAIKEGAFS